MDRTREGSMVVDALARNTDGLVIGDRDASEMSVCGTCGRVRGPWRYSIDGLRDTTFVQRCKCQPREEPLWPRFDFNTSGELCWCCASEALSSGSRWSMILCPDCKNQALALMRREGRLVVPIGRHSLMNQVSLSGADLRLSQTAASKFARRLVRLGGRITVVREWGARQTLANMAAIGAEGEESVPLSDYLERVAALPVDKEAVFGALRRELEP